jgi:hypothetical protein
MSTAFADFLASQPTLIVSLPINSLKLAEAAVRGGADALKVHIHIHHEASGTYFGSLEQERSVLESILALGLPTGIVVGANTAMASQQEVADIIAMGFQAVDAYAQYMPAWMLSLDGIAKMVAVGESTSPAAVEALETIGMDVLEAAIVPASGYGQPLTVDDLATYCVLRDAVASPIVVPTQRAIRIHDVPLLFNSCEVNALMIGAIVTGKEPDTLESATTLYKKALVSL